MHQQQAATDRPAAQPHSQPAATHTRCEQPPHACRRTSTRERAHRRAHTSTLAHNAPTRCTRVSTPHASTPARVNMWQDSQGQHATHRLRPRRCRVQGRPSQQRVRRRRLGRRLPTAMAAGGLGRGNFAPTAGARRVALVRCYVSRRGAESGQAAFAWKRLPRRRKLGLQRQRELVVQSVEMLQALFETGGWYQGDLRVQAFKHLRLLDR